jgi:GH15 family glucan-1,4-alpha-glucosidase
MKLDHRAIGNGRVLALVGPDTVATSAFTICSFWWAEALAIMGELDGARALFNRLLQYANPLGLFSEDIEPETGRLLGNFPRSWGPGVLRSWGLEVLGS